MVPVCASSNRPPLEAGGPGEGALLVAEQLALQQRLRQRRAVHLDQRLLCARRQAVDRLRHHLLAGAALARDQHRGAAGRHLRDHLEHPVHGGGVAEQAARLLLPLQLAAQLAVGKGQLALGQRALDQQAQPLQVDRLLQEVVGAVAHRLHGNLHGRVAGEDDHPHGRVAFGDLLEKLVAGQARHAQIGDHEVDLLVGQHAQRLPAVRRRHHGVTVELQRPAQPFADVPLVVDDQDRGFHFATA